MKRILRTALTMAAFAGLFTFTACDPEEELPTAPSITITTTPAINEAGVVELETGQVITISVSVNAPGGFNVVRLTSSPNIFPSDQSAYQSEYTRNDSGVTLGANNTTASVTFGGFSLSNAGTVTINVQAVDDAGQTTTESFDLDVRESLNESTVILLGAQNATAPSFLNLLTFDTYTIATSNNNQENVDLIYSWSSTASFNYNFAAPSNSAIANFLTNVATWTTRNSTQFYATTLTRAQFIETNTVAEIQALTTGTGVDRLGGLDQNVVVAFTARGKSGLIIVDEITKSEGASQIQISIKVEK
jgi:hypothetical protein